MGELDCEKDFEGKKGGGRGASKNFSFFIVLVFAACRRIPRQRIDIIIRGRPKRFLKMGPGGGRGENKCCENPCLSSIQRDLAEIDMGVGIPCRSGLYDGCISISAVQWLCTKQHPSHNPEKRLRVFFRSLRKVLVFDARAVLQLYPENSEHMDMILQAAHGVGFEGGIVVDYPHNMKAKKFYLCLWKFPGKRPGPSPRLKTLSETQTTRKNKKNKNKSAPEPFIPDSLLPPPEYKLKMKKKRKKKLKLKKSGGVDEQTGTPQGRKKRKSGGDGGYIGENGFTSQHPSMVGRRRLGRRR
ncbi:hypothetical protein AAMO2058_001330200 [Amorphochlora amoebiformis]